MRRWLLMSLALVGATTSSAQSRDSTPAQPVDTLALLRKQAETGDAKQGHALAQYALGDMYRRGAGVAKDEREGFAQIRASAELGYAPAQWDLSVMYGRGVGVRTDVAEAVRWCRKAAEQGHPLAQFNMGQLYGRGEGVARDEVESVRWHRLAAEYAMPGAQYQLARHYAAGTGGLELDRVQAYMWLTLAAPRFSDNSVDRRLLEKLRRALEAKMSAEEIAEAREMASEWKPSRKPVAFRWPPGASEQPAAS